ncbi:WbqC family protein [Thermodesulfobacteriota bacterium]
MNVAMMQPTFMPWLGYFELIWKSDVFIMLDDFQFTVQSWHQRNRLFVNKDQVGWYTVPVRKAESFLASLNRTVINEDVPWRKKMLKRIQMNYGKAPCYKEIYPLVESWLLNEKPTLAEQNMCFVKSMCACLNLACEFRNSSDMPTAGKRSQRVLELLEACDATRYYSAQGAIGYMLADGVFPREGIQVLFQNFEHAPYAQVGSSGSFVPSLSILDALMNTGTAKTLDLITRGTSNWLTWEEALQSRHGAH